MTIHINSIKSFKWVVNIFIHRLGPAPDAGVHMLSVSLYICLFNFRFVLFFVFSSLRSRTPQLWHSS